MRLSHPEQVHRWTGRFIDKPPVMLGADAEYGPRRWLLFRRIEGYLTTWLYRDSRKTFWIRGPRYSPFNIADALHPRLLSWMKEVDDG